ncbi:hypothetical protein [Clostridium saccharoperbutylacetonicum]|uniref:hypothetical protein n=1 Tax=Clostridium saccharoperbutylacetonicum TaxID=36745 RepID=UPI0039ECD0EA
MSNIVNDILILVTVLSIAWVPIAFKLRKYKIVLGFGIVYGFIFYTYFAFNHPM